MTFRELVEKSFLQGYTAVPLSTGQILVVMMFSLLLGMYIWFCYRMLTEKVYYSKSFHISLVVLTILTAAVILAVQSNLVISLGMVGALSIVRFRTAVKDPMDLIFLFWSIVTGIICGTGLVQIAILLALTVTVTIYALNRVPESRFSAVLVIQMDGDTAEEEILERIRAHSGGFQEISRTRTGSQKSVVYELKVKEPAVLADALQEVSGVASVELMKNNGNAAV